MLANGRTRPTLFPNNGSNSSNAESANSSFQFTSENFAPIPDPQENGLEQLKTNDRIILDELEEFTEGQKRQTNSTINNNNKSNFWPNKMAAANTSGPSQQLSNTNGFPLPMASSSGMPNKAGTPVLNMSSSVHNNEVTNMLDQATGNIHSSSIIQPNPTSGNMNMISGGGSSSSIPSSSQYNLFNSRQELLLHGFQAGSRSSNAGHEISNPTMRGAPNASEQYGSPQQRSYISASNESQIRALNRQTPSPFSSNYFPQESHNTQTASRVASSQSEDRTLSSGEHFQWQQPSHRFQTSHSSNPSPGQSLSRSPMQQPSMPPRQPPPYMMTQPPPPPPPQQAPQQQQYVMQSQMKTNTMMSQVPQYYGGMGMGSMMGHSAIQRQQAMTGNQMQKTQPDYSSYQQQHYQHFSQPPHNQYPSQLPPYMQSRQQPPQQQMSPSQSNMSRMMSSHQPILPKPSSDMYGSALSSSRYPNNMAAADSSMEFAGPVINDHSQQPSQHRPPQQSYPSPGGMTPLETPGRPVSQGSFQRGGYYPGYSSSPSPNITMGSPLRNLPEGYPPSNPNAGPPLAGPLPGPGSTSSFPGTPPSSGMPPFSSSTSMSSHGGAAAAAAAAAAVMAAANSFSRYPGVDQSSHGYSASHDGMSSTRGQIGVVPSPRSGTPALSSSGLPAMESSTGGNGVETGLVPSPTLNMLPTAEDVEAMIQSMRSEDACLNEETQTSQSCPTPSAPTTSNMTSTTQASQQLAYTNSSEVNNTSESQGTASVSSPQNVTPHPTTNNTSPLSSFSGEFSAVPSPEVSMSSFGDDDDGMNVAVDDITPTLGQSPGSTAPKQSNKQNLQYGKYLQLYELSDEPERKEFLDKYAAFMESTGNPVRQIPLINNQPLDIFLLYKVIKQNGGLQEVVKRKLWEKVMGEINMPQAQQASWSSYIRNHYTRYLLAYEMTEVASHNSMDNLLEDSGLPPPNATVTCSEAIFPSVTMSSSNQSTNNSSAYPSGYNQITNGPQGYNTYDYRQSDGFPDAPYDSSKFYPSGMDPRPQGAQPSNNSFNVPQYSFNNERTNYPNYNRPYPSHHSSSMQYPGSAALTQLLQQRNQQSPMPGYSQHLLTQRRQMGGQAQLNLSQQDPMHPMWGSQYNASTEPEHMFDYPPNGPSAQSMRSSMSQNQFPAAPTPFTSFSSRPQAPYPPTPQQYQPSSLPHGSSSPSLPRQPMTPTQQQQQQQQQQQSQHPLQKPKFQPHHTKREIYFPPDSVEATKPVFTKKRKLTSRDLGPVEAWRVMMSLKSGLLSETTWALDTLNILLYDDHTVGYFLLSHLPGLLDNLLDHFRRYLSEIFGSFWENDLTNPPACAVTVKGEEEEFSKTEKNDPNDEKLEKDVCRSLTACIAASAIDDNEIAGDDDEWYFGGSKTTIHIQTHLGTAVSPKRSRRLSITTEEKDELSLVKQENETRCKLKHLESELTDTSRQRVACYVKQENSNGSREYSIQCCTGKAEVKNENCFTNSQTNEWDFDSDDSDSSSEQEENSMKGSCSKTDKNDQCLSSVEDFTAKLKKDLDLDIDSSPEECETNSYIKAIIDTKVERSKNSPVIEEESIRQEDSPLSLRTESDDAISRRCVCVSNILRGLSFVPGNDIEMFKHSGLLLIVGKLLLLYHKHAKRVPYKHSYMQDDVELDTPTDDRDDWWWHPLEVLRENALVMLSNIAGQLDLTVYPKTITTPILDGLLHWFVCPSAEAIDPMPTATFGTSLSAQQLVLEALAKMSILGGNAELILTMPPPPRLEALYATLVRLLGQRENPVTRELSLVVLSNLSQTDSSFVCLVEKKQCIAMLLQFIEDAANSINAYSSGGSLAQAGFHSEDFCGTSVDMLRRAASSLVCLARCKPIRSLFLPYQERLLVLTTLKLLERMIGSQLADVLYYLSR